MMSRAQFTFVHPMRVRWAEVDMQSVVFNPNYLMYFDVAVTEYWRALSDGDMASLKSIFDHVYVVKSTVEYHTSARFDDALDVCVRTARLGRSSMRLLFEIHRGDQHLISGENVYVHAIEGKSDPMPEFFRNLILRYESVAPVQ